MATVCGDAAAKRCAHNEEGGFAEAALPAGSHDVDELQLVLDDLYVRFQIGTQIV